MLTASSRMCERPLQRPRISIVLALGLLTAACEPEPSKGRSSDSSFSSLGAAAQPAPLPPFPPGTQVGAYYFGSFSSQDYDPQITKGGCEIYQRQHDVWAGVRDFYPSGNRGWSHPNAFRRLKPAIGYYDLRPPAVLQPCATDGSPPTDGACAVYQHILQAKRYGLSYFSFYWFWDNTAPPPGRPWLNDGLKSFLDVRSHSAIFPNVGPFDYYLTIAEMPRDLAQISMDGAALDTLLDHFERDYYLKPLYKRPLLFILDTRATALCANQLNAGAVSIQEAWHNTEMFIAALRVRAQGRASNLDPIVLINSELPYAGAVRNADGFSCLHPGGIAPRYPWTTTPPTLATFSQGIQPFLTASGNMSTPPRSVLACVTAGFDERPREDLVWYLRSRCPNCPPAPPDAPPPPCPACPSGSTPDIESPRFFEEANSWPARLAYYAESLRQVKHWMLARAPDADPLNLRRYLTIYAWNEWHEGGILEPALEYVSDGVGTTNEDNLLVTKCTLGLGDTSSCPPPP